MINIPNSNDKAQVKIKSLAYNDAVSFFPYDFDIDDQYKPEWGTYEGFGRMDPIMTYKRTTRDVNLSFNVVAENNATAIANFEKLQKLIKFLYPEYDDKLVLNAIRTNVSGLEKSSEEHQKALNAAANEMQEKQKQLQQRFTEAQLNPRTKEEADAALETADTIGQEIFDARLEISDLRQQSEAIAAEESKTRRAITEASKNYEETKSSGFGILNKSPLVQISFMNLLQEGHFVAAITSFKHKMKFDAADTSFSKDGKVIPGEFSINIGFKVLHTDTPGTKSNYTFK